MRIPLILRILSKAYDFLRIVEEMSHAKPVELVQLTRETALHDETFKLSLMVVGYFDGGGAS